MASTEDAAAAPPQDVSQIIVQVREWLQWLTDENIVSDPNGAMKKARSLCEHSRIRAQYSHADRLRVIESYLDGGLTELFSRVWKLIQENRVNMVDDNQPLVRALRYVAESVKNLIDKAAKERQLSILTHMMDCIVTDLRKREFLDIKLAKSDKTAVFGLASVYFHILNTLRFYLDDLPSTKKCNSVEAIKPYVEIASHKLKARVLFVLSYLLADGETDQLPTILDKSNVEFLLKILDDALSQPNHVSKEYGYSALNVLILLYKVCNDSESIISSLIELGIVDTLDGLLHAANAPDAQYSGDKKFSFSEIEEKLKASEIFLVFSLCQSGSDVLRNKPCVIANLETLSEEKFSKTSADFSFLLKRNASLVILHLEKFASNRGELATNIRRKRLAPARISQQSEVVEGAAAAGPVESAATLPDQAPQPRESHVLISYCWSDKDTVKRLVKYLNDRGVKTWLDVKNVRGNIVEAVADAVENASAVLVCFSKEYFQSAKCRAEAQYAFQLNKRIVPVRLQVYRPSGWLKKFCKKYCYNLSSAETFDTNLSDLCEDLQPKPPLPLRQQSNLPVEANSGSNCDAGSSVTSASLDQQRISEMRERIRQLPLLNLPELPSNGLRKN